MICGGNLYKEKTTNKNMVRKIQGNVKGLKTDQFKKEPDIMEEEEKTKEPIPGEGEKEEEKEEGSEEETSN